MITPDAIQKQLTKLWKLFKNGGVVEDILIVEAMAALLTKELSFPNEELRPQLPTTDTSIDFAAIQATLEKLALQIEGGKATLFDPYILFQFRKGRGKGQFPIPRHLLQFMLAIAQIKPDQNIADFTCGSAGFFVYLNRLQTQTGKMVAIEQDTNWVRIAQANLLLHDLSVSVKQGNALNIAGIQEPFAQEQFDCILMAPSFGETIDSVLIHKVFNQNMSTHSDTVLPLFAFTKLHTNGRAVVIVSTDLLKRTDVDALQFRRELITEYILEAVISLPPNALQPFSPLSTNLLLVRKNKCIESTHGWFLDMKNDEYLQGKSRTLTHPAISSSTMQFVTHVLESDTIPFENIYTDTGIPCLQVAKLLQGVVPLGVIISSIEGLQIESINHHSMKKDDHFLLVKISEITGTKTYHCTINLSMDDNWSFETAFIQNIEQHLREWYKQEDEEAVIPLGSIIALSVYPTKAFAIDVYGQLIGAFVPHNTLNNSPFELHPEEYLNFENKIQQTLIDHPAKLLGKVRANQRKLYRRIDNFMGRLDVPTMVGQQIPPKLYTGSSVQQAKTVIKPPPRLLELSDNNIFFNAEQQKIWEKVRQQVMTIDDYLTARYFTIEDVEIGGKTITLATLDLLIRMGIVVPVTILEDDKPVARYRRVTEWDIWQR